MSTVTINFDQFRTPGVRALSGRDKGEDARKQLGLARFDDDTGKKVLIEIPSDIIQVNSSFFLGFFGESMKKLGASFAAKYQIRAVDRVISSFREAQARALIEQASI